MPSWPLSAASPHVWYLPAEIARQMVTVAVDTAVGTLLFVLVPAPSWPSGLAPARTRGQSHAHTRLMSSKELSLRMQKCTGTEDRARAAGSPQQ